MFRLLTLLLTSWLMAFQAFASINVNQAGAGELESLPGIGPSKAAAIMAHRADHGAFKNLSDLDSVPGIGPATLANIGPLVVFSGDGQAAGSQAGTTGSTAQVKTSHTAASPSSVNLNTATASALESLPGIGPSKAAAIISDRQQNGPFGACGELQRVRGIGPATVANIAPRCITK
jgi:competence protein ComEA